MNKLPNCTRCRQVPQPRTSRKLSGAISQGDFWAERGEHGRWVRVYINPRSSMFYPQEAPRGRGRKTRLKPMRQVQDTCLSGLRFKKENDWTKDNIDDELSENWTGTTIFIVDKQHSPDHGTDQRRQRIQSLNQRRVSWVSASD